MREEQPLRSVIIPNRNPRNAGTGDREQAEHQRHLAPDPRMPRISIQYQQTEFQLDISPGTQLRKNLDDTEIANFISGDEL